MSYGKLKVTYEIEDEKSAEDAKDAAVQRLNEEASDENPIMEIEEIIKEKAVETENGYSVSVGFKGGVVGAPLKEKYQEELSGEVEYYSFVNRLLFKK